MSYYSQFLSWFYANNNANAKERDQNTEANQTGLPNQKALARNCPNNILPTAEIIALTQSELTQAIIKLKKRNGYKTYFPGVRNPIILELRERFVKQNFKKLMSELLNSNIQLKSITL